MGTRNLKDEEDFEDLENESVGSEDSGDENDEYEIVIEDDTPEEDRGRKPMPEDIVDDLDNDDLSAYDAGVKERMRQLKKVWHDERRKAESYERERQEAIRAAKQLREDNQRLRQTLSQGEKEYLETVQVAANMALDVAKRNLRDAQDSGESDKIMEAQQAFTEATIRADRAKNFKPTLQNEESSVERQQDSVEVQEPDPKVKAWVDKNPWFTKIEPMHNRAMSIHAELAGTYGENFVGTDKYYQMVDQKMRESYPDYFSSQGGTQNTTPRKKPSNVVAPATRSTSPKQIRLTQSQVSLAKKLGITPEQYAKELIKMEKANG